MKKNQKLIFYIVTMIVALVFSVSFTNRTYAAFAPEDVIKGGAIDAPVGKTIETLGGIDKDVLNGTKKETSTNLSGKVLEYKDKINEDGTVTQGLKSRAVYFINNVIFKYGTPIALFILFISILAASLTTISKSQNAKERVLVKERFMKIIMAAIIFSSSFVIINIAVSYVEKNMTALMELQDNAIDLVDPKLPPVDTDTSWYGDIVFSLVEGITHIVDYLKEDVFAKYISSTKKIETIGDIIMYIEGDYDLDGNPTFESLTLSPFTRQEWSTYMKGYAMLSVISVAILLIALIKDAGNIILNAGNSEKMVEIRQDYLRFAVGTLGIIFAPYIIRTILLLFNCMLILVPVNTNIVVDLSFGEEYGYLGTIADCLGAITEIKIFGAFIVRKIMITFMLISAPIIFATWTVSNKFRSFSLWLGELMSNCATQFCYGIVLFFIIVISYNGQSPVITLIIVNMFIKLADFLKDSLQGLITKWGGVNESQVAEQSFSEVVNVARQVPTTARKIPNTIGSAFVGIADLNDRKKVSKGWKKVRNFGNIVSGNFSNIETNVDRYRAADGGVVKEMRLLSDVVDTSNSEVRELIRTDVLVDTEKQSKENLVRDIASGSVKKEQIEALRNKQGKSEIDEKIIALYDKSQELQEMKEVHTALSQASKSKKAGLISNVQRKIEARAINKITGKKEKKEKAFEERKNRLNKAFRKCEQVMNGEINLSQDEQKKILDEIVQSAYNISLDGLNIDIKLPKSEADEISYAQQVAIRQLGKLDIYDPDQIKKVMETQKNFEEREEKLEEVKNNKFINRAKQKFRDRFGDREEETSDSTENNPSNANPNPNPTRTNNFNGQTTSTQNNNSNNE